MSLFPDSTSPQNQVKTGWTVSQALDWNACTVAPCCFNMYLTRVSAREYNFNCWYNFKQRWKSSHNWVRMMRVQRNLQSCENSPEISLGMGELHFMITERFSSIQFSSVQFKMVSMRSKPPIIMRYTPSLRSLPNVALETVPMFVWLAMAISRPFKEDRLALPLSVPLSSRSML